MIARIEKSKAFGKIYAPPSKSMAHRYLICGALSGGSVIKGVSFSEDVKATLSCLESLGANISIDGDTVTIGGIDIKKGIKSNMLFCNESGSTLRFLIPICLLFDEKMMLTGSKRLFERSLSVYEKLCEEQSLAFLKGENAIALKGKLSSGKYAVRGDISSQFITGLIFALSLLENDSEIEIIGDLESASYLSLTIKALADFGVRISRSDEHTIIIKGNQSYKKRELWVEGDYSNAAFLDAFNLLGGSVLVSGLDENSGQGDRVYKDIYPLLLKESPVVDVSDCPDLAPIIMSLGAALNGVKLTGTKRLKFKESDRGNAMKAELIKFGCKVEVNENDIIVHKCELNKPTLPLDSHNDHRIVMALSVLCSITGGDIYGAQAVAKSYPDFFKVIKSLGVNVIMGEIA